MSLKRDVPRQVIVKKCKVTECDEVDTHDVSIFVPEVDGTEYHEYTLHVHSKIGEREIFAWKQYEVHSPNFEEISRSSDAVFASIAELPIEWQRVIRSADRKHLFNQLPFIFVGFLCLLGVQAFFNRNTDIVYSREYYWCIAISPFITAVLWLYTATPARIIVKHPQKDPIK